MTDLRHSAPPLDAYLRFLEVTSNLVQTQRMITQPAASSLAARQSDLFDFSARDDYGLVIGDES